MLYIRSNETVYMSDGNDVDKCETNKEVNKS